MWPQLEIPVREEIAALPIDRLQLAGLDLQAAILHHVRRAGYGGAPPPEMEIMLRAVRRELGFRLLTAPLLRPSRPGTVAVVSGYL